jgi:N-methylhydantoinase B
MTGSTRVTANVRSRTDGTLFCTHCEHDIPGTAATYLARVPVHVGPPTDGGPHIFPDPTVYVDTKVVFRQYFCPHCYTALQTEIVPT